MDRQGRTENLLKAQLSFYYEEGTVERKFRSRGAFESLTCALAIITVFAGENLT